MKWMWILAVFAWIDQSDALTSIKPTSSVGVSSIAAIALVMPSPVHAIGSIAHGQVLFQANCAGCHAGGQNFVKEKKTLKQDALQKYQSLEKEKLQQLLTNGMPHKFLPLKFERTDYSDVVDYVLDQALNDKW